MMMVNEEIWRHEMLHDEVRRIREGMLTFYEDILEGIRFVQCWNILCTTARTVRDYKKNKGSVRRVDNGFRAQKTPLRI
jgi:hypothetical protein